MAMQLPNWIRRIGRWVGKAWYGFGQASRAFTMFKAISWLSALGLGGVVASFLAHLTAPFGDMSPGLRWVFFSGVGLLVIAFVLGLAQWLALRFQPAWLAAGPIPKEHDLLSQQASEAETLRGENRNLTAQLDGLRNHSEYLEGVARSYSQKLTFGEELPEPRPLDPVDFRHMVSGLHELRPSLKDTLAGTNAVWSHLAADIRAREFDHQWRMLAWRLGRLEKSERRQFEQAVSAFETVLEVRKGDPRPYLAGIYNTYRRWRDQIRDVAQAFGRPIGAIGGAIEWRDAERRFLEILERKLATPELKVVKDARDAYDDTHGPLDDPFSA